MAEIFKSGPGSMGYHSKLGRPFRGHPEFCRTCGGNNWYTQPGGRNIGRARCSNCTANKYRHLRMEVLLAYGGKCGCCGEWRYEFLGFDHINGGGNAHRREVRGNALPGWLKRNNYPITFRVLCHSCNMSYGFRGYCPHQEE